MTLGNNARGNPIQDENFDDAIAATTGKWIDIRGCVGYNVMIVGGVAPMSATFTVEASFDGVTNHGTIQSGLTVGDPDANVNMNEPVPFVRLKAETVLSGTISKVFIYGVAHV